MKSILFILTINILFGSAILSCEKRNQNIQIRIKQIERIENKNSSDSNDFYTIKIEMMNTSDTAIGFWTMTCSWEQNWMSNSPSVYFFNPECNSNYPYVIQIEKNKIIRFNGMLRVEKSAFNEIQYLKIGFIFVPERELKDQTKFLDVLLIKLKDPKNIIWSESFKLNK